MRVRWYDLCLVSSLPIRLTSSFSQNENHNFAGCFSVLWLNSLTRGSLKSKGFISIYSCSLAWREVRAGACRQEPVGTGHWGRLPIGLFHRLIFSFLLSTYQDHLARAGISHTRAGPFMAIRNRENSPRLACKSVSWRHFLNWYSLNNSSLRQADKSTSSAAQFSKFYFSLTLGLTRVTRGFYPLLSCRKPGQSGLIAPKPT